MHLIVKQVLCLMLALVYVLPIGLAHAEESYKPLGHDWREVIWGYADKPCDNYVYRDAYFRDFGNEDREVVSAKLYVKAHYGFGEMPPYCPPLEDCEEEDEEGGDERASSISTSCDGSKFHTLFFNNEPLPDDKEVVFDLPLSDFECDNEGRSFVARFSYNKTHDVNVTAQLAGMSLELEFGEEQKCTKVPDEPTDPYDPDAPTGSVYRYRDEDAGWTDHFYTTNWNELGSGGHGYVLEGIGFRIHTSKVKDSVPLYRYFAMGGRDHFYTTNWKELGSGKMGYAYEGIQGYVYQSKKPGTVPLYRYMNVKKGDHFYTISWAEVGSGKDGYAYEGIQCYVFPPK